MAVRIRLLRIFIILLCGLLPQYAAVRAQADGSNSVSIRIQGVPRIKQIDNYCGPACLASVMQFYGSQISQESIGREVYDSDLGATNGADLLYYARQHGYAAYSWNATVEDAKRKLAQGTPVIVLHQNTLADSSGHYRILIGCDDEVGAFMVIDPYYEELTEISYTDSRRLWEKKGFWAMVIVPRLQDPYANELGSANPVTNMDLAYAFFKRGMYAEALDEARTALAVQPGNSHALAIHERISEAIGAGGR